MGGLGPAAGYMLCSFPLGKRGGLGSATPAIIHAWPGKAGDEAAEPPAGVRSLGRWAAGPAAAPLRPAPTCSLHALPPPPRAPRPPALPSAPQVVAADYIKPVFTPNFRAVWEQLPEESEMVSARAADKGTGRHAGVCWARWGGVLIVREGADRGAGGSCCWHPASPAGSASTTPHVSPAPPKRETKHKP